MKKIGLIVTALLCLTQSAYAMLPITENNIERAQQYGVERKGASTLELVAPWTIYDRKLLNKYGLGEKTVVYTPYLMAALDAQSAAKGGTTASLARGMKVAKDYQGVLALAVTVSTTSKLEPKNLRVRMYQGTNVIDPYYTNLNSAKQRSMQVSPGQGQALQKVNVWDLQYFVYFDLTKLNAQRPMVFAVTDKAGGTREFVINLTKVN
jgi:hypothetical protein